MRRLQNRHPAPLRGATVIEYSLCCALVCLFSIGTLSAISDPISQILGQGSEMLSGDSGLCPNCMMGRFSGFPQGGNNFASSNGPTEGRNGFAGGGTDTSSWIERADSALIDDGDGEPGDGDGNAISGNEELDQEAFSEKQSDLPIAKR